MSDNVKFDNQVCVNCVYIDAMEPVCPYVNLAPVSLIDEVLVCTSFVRKGSSREVCLFCKSEFELQEGCYQLCDKCIESLVKLEKLLKSEFGICIGEKWISLVHQFQKFVLMIKDKSN